VDLAFNEGSKAIGYMVIINENTRFVFAWPIYAKDTETIATGLYNFFMHFAHKNLTLKGDGERGFQAIKDRMDDPSKIIRRGVNKDGPNTQIMCSNAMYRRNVKWFLVNKQRNLTNSFSIIDSAIRVIRNILSIAFNHQTDPFSIHNSFFQALRIYNNTVHSAFGNRFTPKQMQEDPELEYAYIRFKQQQADEAQRKQGFNGYNTYQVGEELMVHIP
jgi:hypothetical protein